MGSNRMTNGHDRRRFLQIAGTGAAASLAGCAALGNQTDDSDGDDDLLTVIVAPDQEEIDKLVEGVESEEIDPMEAQQRQQELMETAVSDFEARAEEESDLTIEESTKEMGLFQVDAKGEVVIDALRNGEVSSIHTSAAYDQILERQQQRQQQAPPQQAPENGSETNGSDGSDAEGDSDDGGDSDGDGADSTGDGTNESTAE